MADKAMTEKDLAVTTVLGVEPLTVETRPAGLAADPTPTEAVFIRNNLGPPAADGPWTVELTGTVSEARLSLEDVFGSDRKSTRLNSSHVKISYAVFCLKKKK